MPTLCGVLALLLLTACSTAYQDMTYSGGVSGAFVGEDRIRVDVRGNRFTRRSTVLDYAMLHAAELARDAGADEIRLVHLIDRSKVTGTQDNTRLRQAYTDLDGLSHPHAASAAPKTIVRPGYTAIFDLPQRTFVHSTGPRLKVAEILAELAPKYKAPD